MLIAITRPVSESIHDCELTHMDREPICHATAVDQHSKYVAAMKDLGVTIVELDSLHEHADAVFVEDITVVVDEIAVLTRPGAESRRGEVESILNVIAQHRPIARIEPPGTLEGGDVMQAERTIYVGLSTRTNQAGFDQFKSLLEPHGYRVEGVPIPGALHLKTAATYIGDGVVLANPHWLDVTHFHGLDIIEVHPDEPFAGNAIRIDEAILFPEQFPHTAGRLEARGFRLVRVPSTELAKAEGSLTCKSVIFNADD
ncbi:MAG: dimethylargininase [Planctomycetes bacterium]|jgi:dimethylargininase|nr:dimethylargininase [Planctomycetota bacterium]MCP4838603.1 dimethylargininase [Planctomycetota bacterium]